MTNTVIIPCHNNAQWITRALDSIQGQSRRPDEVIVVVDRCSDRSASVAADHGLRPTVLETDFGNAAESRNFGVRFANSETVSFLDADDWWLDHHLEDALHYLSLNNDSAYISHYAEFWQQSARVFNQKPLFEGQPKTGLSHNHFYDFFLSVNPGWCTCGMVVRTDCFRAVGGFDITQLRRHDAEMFARVIHGKTWTYNPRIGFMYRKEIGATVSSPRAECSLYRFLADQKITNLYDPARALGHLRSRAEICLSECLSSADDEHLLRLALPLCSPYLRFDRRIFFLGARYAPSLARRLRLVIRKIIRPQ